MGNVSEGQYDSNTIQDRPDENSDNDDSDDNLELLKMRLNKREINTDLNSKEAKKSVLTDQECLRRLRKLNNSQLTKVSQDETKVNKYELESYQAGAKSQ